MAADKRVDMISQLELTYAMVLLELAEEQATPLDELAAEVAQLAKLAERELDLTRLLSTRTVAIRDRSQIIERLFSGRVSDLLYRFIQTVNQKNRLDHLPGILRAFDQLVQQRHGIVEVAAYVATSMNEASVNQVAEAVGQVMGKQAVVHQYVDPTLIGGLKLRIADQLIDGSVATQLRLIRENMITTGRDHVRRATVATD